MARLYDYTKVSCAPSGTATAIRPGTFDDGDGFRFTIHAKSATMQVEGSVGVQHLRRISAVPARCLTPGPSDPRAVFDVFWATYAENYPFFKAKGIDWQAERDRVRPQITKDTTDDELFELMKGMLEPRPRTTPRTPLPSARLWMRSSPRRG